MLKLASVYSLLSISNAADCVNMNIEFPNGFAGNSGG